MGFAIVGELDGEGDFEVFPENWPAVRLFCALGTQWRRRHDGRRLGLDYSAITPLVLSGLGVTKEDWPDVFQAVRMMESDVLEAMAD